MGKYLFQIDQNFKKAFFFQLEIFIFFTCLSSQLYNAETKTFIFK